MTLLCGQSSNLHG